MVTLAGALELLSTIMWSLIGITITGAIVWFFVYWKKFNKDILILDEATGGDVVRNDKAKEEYSDKQIVGWRIRKEKVSMSCPPKEAVLNRNGKKFAILVRVQGDQYHWCDVSKFKVDAESKVGKYFVIAEDAKRQLADQLRKAEHERTTKMNQLLANIIPFIGIAIILMGAYFMYDAVGTHMNEMGDKFNAAASTMAEVSKQNAIMLEEMRTIQSGQIGPPPSEITVTIPEKKVPN